MNKEGTYFVSYNVTILGTIFGEKEREIHQDRIVEFEEPLSLASIEELREHLISEYGQKHKTHCEVAFQNFILL